MFERSPGQYGVERAQVREAPVRAPGRAGPRRRSVEGGGRPARRRHRERRGRRGGGRRADGAGPAAALVTEEGAALFRDKGERRGAADGAGPAPRDPRRGGGARDRAEHPTAAARRARRRSRHRGVPVPAIPGGRDAAPRDATRRPGRAARAALGFPIYGDKGKAYPIFTFFGARSAHIIGTYM